MQLSLRCALRLRRPAGPHALHSLCTNAVFCGAQTPAARASAARTNRRSERGRANSHRRPRPCKRQQGQACPRALPLGHGV